MYTASTIGTPTLDATPRRRSALQVAAIGALAATVANVALWAGGRAADVSFQVSPPTGFPAFQVGVVLVVLTTLLTFAVVSAGGPLSAAHDTATGALLATMHLFTGAVFVATAARVRAR